MAAVHTTSTPSAPSTAAVAQETAGAPWTTTSTTTVAPPKSSSLPATSTIDKGSASTGNFSLVTRFREAMMLVEAVLTAEAKNVQSTRPLHALAR